MFAVLNSPVGTAASAKLGTTVMTVGNAPIVGRPWVLVAKMAKMVTECVSAPRDGLSDQMVNARFVIRVHQNTGGTARCVSLPQTAICRLVP